MVKHNATPWSHYRAKLRPTFGGIINEVQCPGGRPIVQWGGFDDSRRPERKHAANAAFIVLACNHHDELVSALERARDTIDSSLDSQEHVDDINRLLRRAKGAN